MFAVMRTDRPIRYCLAESLVWTFLFRLPAKPLRPWRIGYPDRKVAVMRSADTTLSGASSVYFDWVNRRDRNTRIRWEWRSHSAHTKVWSAPITHVHLCVSICFLCFWRYSMPEFYDYSHQLKLIETTQSTRHDTLYLVLNQAQWRSYEQWVQDHVSVLSQCSIDRAFRCAPCHSSKRGLQNCNMIRTARPYGREARTQGEWWRTVAIQSFQPTMVCLRHADDIEQMRF